MPLFAVINTRGPVYRHGVPMEEQDAWRAHADFMNALVAEGFVALGGPLAEPDVLLIVRAASETTSARASPPTRGTQKACSRSRASRPGPCGSAPCPERRLPHCAIGRTVRQPDVRGGPP